LNLLRFHVFLFGEENIMRKTGTLTIIQIITILSALILFSGCGGGGGSSNASAGNHVFWTWVSGDITVNKFSIYGTKGVVSATNRPGSRGLSASWTDKSGNLWLFGGYGLSSIGVLGGYYYLNDLWKFDGTNWTWVSGDSTANQSGIYGTKGVAAASNIPGGREGSISWTDSSGNLWLFGGNGYDSAGSQSYLNDLWKFDGTNWTWVSGDSTVAYSGAYGIKGVAAAMNKPGSRAGSISWTDNSGNLWLFGGNGYDSAVTVGWLNDLWKFDGTNWTWVSGDSTVAYSGTYGIKGVAAATNKPGGRAGSVSWTDSSGNLWLFGGLGYSAWKSGCLNDLWKFDGTNWTWVSGDNTVVSGDTADHQSGVYGIKGIAAAANKPGSRYGSINWKDSKGNLWLFGGRGYDSAGDWGYLTDLWKFDGTNWTWVSGDSTANQSGVYGTIGVAAAANKPGSRYGSISWTDSSGNLWLFGGDGYDSAGSLNGLNDLWKFSP
jgi:N-acetylneuraminic acid mutarotase